LAPHWHHISNTPEGPHVLFGGVADDAEVVRVIDRQRHRLRLRTYTEALYVIRIYVCMCVIRIYVYTYIRMHACNTYIRMHACNTYIRMHVCMHACTYIRMHVCTYKFRPNQTTTSYFNPNMFLFNLHIFCTCMYIQVSS
jgi:hypothetical protein